MGTSNDGGKRDGTDDWPLGRRRFVGLGAAAIAGAAGCTDSGGEAGEEESAEEAEGAEMAVRDAAVNATEIHTEQTFEVTATIENTGGEAGTFHAELRMDDVIVDTEAVEVDPGGTESVTFSGSFGEPGEYEVGVNDVVVDTVRVELPPPEFELVEASLAETTVAVGEEIEARATVANVGGQEGSVDVDLRADDRTVASRELTIDADGRESTAITHAFGSPGSYEIELGGEPLGVVTVEIPATFEIDETAVPERSAGVGEPLDVDVRVENVGEQAGTAGATLFADGNAVDTSEGSLEPGESAVARFAPSFEAAGAYSLSVAVASGAPPEGRAGADDAVELGTVYVTDCYVAVSETVAVESGSEEAYAFDLAEYDELRIGTRTRDGVDPSLTVVGPSGALIDESGDGAIETSFVADEAGRHEVRLENGSVLPWRDGTWAIEIVRCTWEE
ncbi:CARDB domain-containing protein [Halalkalicoccus tibetensis]|uniref:CARDB domain-containing protein n=1 Tax=Halalkalicoccus tibetensis TaxID=175632 RepID=A0ABD5V716_9EURY